METKTKITYALHTTKAQYDYLYHELQKTRLMYEVLRKEKEKSQGQYDEMMAIKGYMKHYLTAMSKLEMKWMCDYLSQDKPLYDCSGVVEKSFHWRGINLYPMLSMACGWKRKPFYEKWILRQSVLYEHKGVLYLALVFDMPE